MFFPLRDENPTERVPFVNYALMALNVAVFLYTEPILGSAWLFPGYGLVPTRIVADPGGEAFTVLTSMFMHGGWLHLASNLLFLHIFGDNLEDMMGHLRYVVFYVLCGAGAALAQTLADTQSPLPILGASGAVAGVVGGYLLLFPRAPIIILNLTPLIFFIGLLPVLPAWLVAGEFFLINFVQALGEWGGASHTGGEAVFAHLGGFVGGFCLTRLFLRGQVVVTRQWRGFRGVPSSAPSASASATLAPGTARWRRRRRLK
jgi:membrane associated rhomboid family serine protease